MLICLLIYFSSSYRRTYQPASYHIAQELQKYNIPDYRPRQEQYVLYFLLLVNFISLLPKVSKSYQESPRCSTSAPYTWFRLQSN